MTGLSILMGSSWQSVVLQGHHEWLRHQWFITLPSLGPPATTGSKYFFDSTKMFQIFPCLVRSKKGTPVKAVHHCSSSLTVSPTVLTNTIDKNTLIFTKNPPIPSGYRIICPQAHSQWSYDLRGPPGKIIKPCSNEKGQIGVLVSLFLLLLKL